MTTSLVKTKRGQGASAKYNTSFVVAWLIWHGLPQSAHLSNISGDSPTNSNVSLYTGLNVILPTELVCERSKIEQGIEQLNETPTNNYQGTVGSSSSLASSARTQSRATCSGCVSFRAC